MELPHHQGTYKDQGADCSASSCDWGTTSSAIKEASVMPCIVEATFGERVVRERVDGIERMRRVYVLRMQALGWVR